MELSLEERKQLNIYEKISCIMEDVQYLRKDDHVSTGQGKGYKAITEEKVTTAVRNAMIKYGVVIIPVKQDYERTDTVVTDKNGNEKITRLAQVQTEYRVQNVDDKDDYVLAVSTGEGADTQDKGVGKAMTYAYKYLLLRMFAIPTGEDPDKIASDVYTEELTGGTDKAISKKKAKDLEEYIIAAGKDVDAIKEYYKVATLEALTERQYGETVKIIEKGKDKGND